MSFSSLLAALLIYLSADCSAYLSACAMSVVADRSMHKLIMFLDNSLASTIGSLPYELMDFDPGVRGE